MSRMSGLIAAAGLAFINTVGLLGGFFGPMVFGLIEGRTGSDRTPFVFVVIAGLAGIALAALLKRTVGREDQPLAPERIPAIAD